MTSDSSTSSAGSEDSDSASKRQIKRVGNLWENNPQAGRIYDPSGVFPIGKSGGAIPNQFECVWSNDFNKYASQIYTKNFGEENHVTADIRGINPENIPDFDLLCAGFPCQAFSVAGKRKGFEETRGTLFFEILRIAKAKRPALLLLENVKGLLNHDGGRTFTIILQALDELGYWVEWQVLNSKYHGVPQNRERVFIVGHLRNGRSRPIFPILKNGSPAPEPNEGQHGQITNTVTRGNASGFSSRGNYVLAPEIAGTLTGGGQSGGLHSDMTILAVHYGESQQDRVHHIEEISPTVPSFRTPDKQKIIDGLKVRRLTPVECERLQGFPAMENTISLQIQREHICLDPQRSHVNVEIRNHKLLRLVGNVGKEGSNEFVSSVEQNLNIKNQQTDRPVQENVRINCVETRIEIYSQKKSFLFANTVEKQNSSLLPITKEDFALLIAGINSTSEKIMQVGREGLHQNEQSLILHKNGKIFVKPYGLEMMQLAEDVRTDSITLKKHLKFIISNHSGMKKLDSNLITSYYYVLHAIIGFIQTETRTKNISNLEIHSILGWTFGISDTQRYRALGNAVTVNVIEFLGHQIRESLR